MKRIGSTILLAGLFVSAWPRAIPQQAVPPPPNPADSSPTLAVTMQFIQEKLNGIGTITYTRHNSTDDTNIQEQMLRTDVIADAALCMLQSYLKANILDEPGSFVKRTTPLKDVKNIVVTPLDSTHYPGRPIFNLELSVPNYTVEQVGVSVSYDKKHIRHETTIGSLKMNSDQILFTDEELANRVAKAMLHAVELCSAAAPTSAKKPNEPF